MAILLLAFCLTAAGVANARQFHLQNNLGYTVWVGILGNSGKGTPDNGGFTLNAGGRRTVNVADNWGGRFWARTGCGFDGSGRGHCATGDCGDKLQCNGAGGVPPVSLAEVTLQGDRGQDFYDVSFVDGFNVPLQMKPVNGGGSQYRCGTAGCTRNLNPSCPGALQVRSGNSIVACKSACTAFNTDRDCCRGSYNNPNVCSSGESARYFKNNCPSAYSYAYDDQTSTFTCDNTDYDIIFG